MVDRHLVTKKLSLINEYLEFLKQNKKNISEKSVKKNFGLRMEVAYAIQTIVQACTDICTHLASDEKWELPDHSAHAFKIALRHHVISEEVCREFQSAVKMRNVIVHQYDELNEKILVNTVHQDLPLFDRFCDEIKKWIKSRAI